jgi:hypothetical protein
VIEYWPGRVASRDNCRVGQISLFTVAETASMRDITKRRNYSAEAERFRREQAGRRAWGLTQRHARKMSRLHGSVAAAWESYRNRADELLGSAVPAIGVGETGLPTPGTPEPAMPAVVATAQAGSVPVVSDITDSEPALPDPALPDPALPDPAPAELARFATIRLQLIASEAGPCLSSAQAVPGPPGGSESIGSEPPPAGWAPGASKALPLSHRNCVTRQSRPRPVDRLPARGRIRCHPAAKCSSRPAGRRGPGRRRSTAATGIGNARQ